MWVQIPLMVVCQWLATGWWFSAGTPVSSTNKTDCHDITEILLKHCKPNQTINLIQSVTYIILALDTQNTNIYALTFDFSEETVVFYYIYTVLIYLVGSVLRMANHSICLDYFYSIMTQNCPHFWTQRGYRPMHMLYPG